MKRIIAFIFIFLVIAIIPLLAPRGYDYAGLNAITFVTSKDIDDENYISIKSGNDYFIKVDKTRALELAKKLDIKGYNLHFDRSSDVEALKAHFIDYCMPKFEVNGIEILEGYTKSYCDFRIVEGKKINVQMAILKNEIIIGFPLILTGF